MNKKIKEHLKSIFQLGFSTVCLDIIRRILFSWDMGVLGAIFLIAEILFGLCFVVFIFTIPTRKRLKKAADDRKYEFYKKCVREKVLSINSASDRGKVQRIIEEMDITVDNVELYFKEAFAYAEKHNTERINNAIAYSKTPRKMINFYKKCKENKILSITNEGDRQKAILIAENEGLKYEDFDEYFAAAFECGKKADELKLKKELDNIRKSEREKYETLVKYKNYSLRDKRIKILEDKFNEYSEALEAIRALPSMMMNSVYEDKENDWALTGGIVSGLAGGAAGLAAASDVQRQNAEIRARNQANREAVRKVAYGNNMTNAFLNAISNVSEYKEKLENAKVSLVDETISSEELLKKVNFTDISLDISKTGAVSISAIASLKNKLTIFENVNAVVDGVLIAKLYQNGKLIGSTEVVLPCFGISLKPSELEGLCLCNAEIDAPCTIEWSTNASYKLWAIEE